MQSELTELLDRWAPREGVNATPVEGVTCIKVTYPQRWAERHWHACLCVVVQGIKEIELERRVYREHGPHYIISPVDLPLSSRVVGVAPGAPLLSLKLDFSHRAVREVASQLDRVRVSDDGRPIRAMYMGPASERVLDATLRVARLFDRPDDAPVLAPLVTRELIFHLLDGADGSPIRRLVRAGSPPRRIAEAALHIHHTLAGDLDIPALAKRAGMSRAVFFRRFKEATEMSPLQYQKRLRLLEARRLMIEEGESAEASALKVGYASASQFSREYARLFGNAPRRDVRDLKASAETIQAL